MKITVSPLLEKNYAMLKSSAKNLSLLCIEDITDSLKDNSLSNLKILATSHKNSDSKYNDIIPSLSVAKNYTQDSVTFFHSISEINDFIVSKTNNNCNISNSSWKMAEGYGYELIKFKNLGVTVAIKTRSNVNKITDTHRGNLEIVAKCLDLIKRNSLNFWNDYQDQIRNDLNSLGKKFSKSKTITLIEFCLFIEKKYKTKTHCFELDSNLENWVNPNSKGNYPKYCKTIIEGSKERFKYKKPILGKYKSRYYLIIPFKKDSKDELIDKVILVTSTKSIPQNMPRNIDKYIQQYFDSYLKGVKGEFLNKLQNQTKKFKSTQAIQENILKVEQLLRALSKITSHSSV